jgi:predicted phosphoribosyltransferase
MLGGAEQSLRPLCAEDPLVLALPRGDAPAAFEVAQASQRPASFCG